MDHLLLRRKTRSHQLLILGGRSLLLVGLSLLLFLIHLLLPQKTLCFLQPFNHHLSLISGALTA